MFESAIASASSDQASEGVLVGSHLETIQEVDTRDKSASDNFQDNKPTPSTPSCSENKQNPPSQDVASDKSKTIPGVSDSEGVDEVVSQSLTEAISTEQVEDESSPVLSNASSDVPSLSDSQTLPKALAEDSTSSSASIRKTVPKSSKIKGGVKQKSVQQRLGNKAKIKVLEGKIVGLQRTLHTISSNIPEKQSNESSESCKCSQLESTINSMAHSISKIEQLTAPKEMESRFMEAGYNYKTLESRCQEAETQNIKLKLLADDLLSQVDKLKAGKEPLTSVGVQTETEPLSNPVSKEQQGDTHAPNIPTSNRFQTLQSQQQKEEGQEVTTESGASLSHASEDSAAHATKSNSSNEAKKKCQNNPNVEWFKGEGCELSNLYQPGIPLHCFGNTYCCEAGTMGLCPTIAKG